MKIEALQKYIPILRLYDLVPKYAEEYGKVTKIYTDQGTFALKRLENNQREQTGLLRNMHLLNESGFRGTMPLYYTRDGRFFVYEQEQGYYLMPWFEQTDAASDENNHFYTMFSVLGNLHKATKKEKDLSSDEIQRQYEQISGQWENEKEMLDGFIDKCERKWYMSPFELYFCSYYHQTIRSHEFAVKMLEEWHQVVKEKGKIRTALIHGNLSAQHFLVDKQNNGFFISLEKAREEIPTYDLVQFYYRALNTYPAARTERFEWLMEYEKVFPLQKEEKKLMISYLAYPQHMIGLVKKYIHVKGNRNELKQTGKLQKINWLMNNLEHLVSKIQQDMYNKEGS